MGSYVVKCTREDDMYVYWSSVVDAPTFLGTRAEMLHHLQFNTRNDDPEERMERADKRGCSALWPSAQRPIYGWQSDGMIYEQRGWLPRARLFDAAAAWLLHDEEAVWDLLEPFEDDVPVRRG